MNEPLCPALKFLIDARDEIRAGASLQRFMDLRYPLLSKVAPHGVFSVDRATPDFFEHAVAHVRATEPLPKAEPGRPLSEYDQNYIKWIKKIDWDQADTFIAG